jgi:hypothetical protein
MPSLSACFDVSQLLRYDVDMIQTGQGRSSAISSKEYDQLLNASGRNRTTGQFGFPQMPRPRSARLDRQGKLSWQWSTSKGWARSSGAVQRIPPDLCFTFAQLANGDDEAIRSFAERWGPLNWRSESVHDTPREAVEDWRRYAVLAQAILRFVAQGFKDSDGVSDWKTIWSWLYPGQTVPELALLPLKFRMSPAAMAVNRWYSAAPGNGIVEVANKNLQLQPFASTLLGTLAGQIAEKISRNDESVICAGCHQLFVPKRPPSRGTRQYCKRCRRKKLPERDAARDYRLRLIAKKSGSPKSQKSRRT